MEELLSDQDRFFIRLNYTEIKDNVRIAAVIQGLTKSGLFNSEDDTFFKEWQLKPDNTSEYFIFNVLLQRATYTHLQELRNVLLQKQPEVLHYFPEVKDLEEAIEQNNNDITGVEECVMAAGEPSTQPNEPVTDPATGDNNLKHEGSPASRQQIPNPATTDHTDTINEVVQAADEPDGKSGKGFLSAFKRRFSFKKKKRPSKNNFKQFENRSTENNGTHADNKKSEESVVPHNEDPQVTPAGIRRLLGQNQKTKIKRITSFTDAFLEYKFKDKGRPYGKGMCVIFALFTADLSGYVHDVKKLETHFLDLQYEVRSGPGYTNIKKAELFERIAEVNTYMDEHQTFDRLVVVILTHGKKDGLLTCEDRDGLIEEQQQVVFTKDRHQYSGYVPVKTTVAEIVEHFKHDQLKSMKDMPKLFLVQACRGQGVVQAANVPKQPGLDEVDASGLDTSQLQFNTQTPIDGDILVCNATTEHHSSLVNPYTGSWFIQKTLEVFKKYQTSQHVVDMMTVVNLAVSECRGAVYPKDADPYKAIQIPCITSSLRKKFYLYNANTTNSSTTEGNHEISLPLNVRLPEQFVTREEKPPVFSPGQSRPINIPYRTDQHLQPQQLPQLQQPQYGSSTQPYPVSYSEPHRQPPNLQQRQPGGPYHQAEVYNPKQQGLPGLKPKQTGTSSPHLHKRQPDSSNKLPVLHQHGNGRIQGHNSTNTMPLYATAKSLTVYRAGSPEQVHQNKEPKAPLATTETNDSK